MTPKPLNPGPERCHRKGAWRSVEALRPCPRVGNRKGPSGEQAEDQSGTLGGRVTWFEANKGNFQDFLREFIRHRMCASLEAKHTKWQGVSKTDFKVTTALLRSMDSTQYGRTAPMRLLSNAHATRQSIVPTL